MCNNKMCTKLLSAVSMHTNSMPQWKAYEMHKKVICTSIQTIITLDPQYKHYAVQPSM